MIKTRSLEPQARASVGQIASGLLPHIAPDTQTCRETNSWYIIYEIYDDQLTIVSRSLIFCHMMVNW